MKETKLELWQIIGVLATIVILWTATLASATRHVTFFKVMVDNKIYLLDRGRPFTIKNNVFGVIHQFYPDFSAQEEYINKVKCTFEDRPGVLFYFFDGKKRLTYQMLFPGEMLKLKQQPIKLLEVIKIKKWMWQK
jgi:hypothetical protein